MLFAKFLFLICAISFMLSPTAFAEDSGNSEASWYAVCRLGDRKDKLYTKGDIFYSDRDITKCLRIEEIGKDVLMLKDVRSKESFSVKIGEEIPLEDSGIIFEKTIEKIYYND